MVKSAAAPYGHTAVLESERVLHDRPQNTWSDRRHFVVRLLCECPRRGSGEAEPPAQADGRRYAQGRQAGNQRSDRYSETGRSDGLPHAPFPVSIYILEGAFTLEMDGRQPVTVKAGEGMVEPPNVKMTGFNKSTTEPMKVVIFYVADPGTPFLDPLHH